MGLGLDVKRRRVFEDWCSSRQVGRRRRAASFAKAASWTASSRNAPRSASSRRRDGRRLIYLREGRRRRLGFCKVSRAGGCTGGGGGRATTGRPRRAARSPCSLAPDIFAPRFQGEGQPAAAGRREGVGDALRASGLLCILVGGQASPCQLAIFPKPRAGSPPAPRRFQMRVARASRLARGALFAPIWHKTRRNGWCGVPGCAFYDARMLFVRVAASVD